MLSRTLPRLVTAVGFALLCYAAFDTIHRASLAPLCVRLYSCQAQCALVRR